MISAGVGTIIASTIAALASLVGLFVGLCRQKRSDYLNIVSSNRVEWIQKLKKLISDYCEMMDKYQWNSEKPNRESIYKATAVIKLHLNFKGAPDRTILQMIRRINNIYLGEEEYHLKNQHEVESWLNYLLLISQIYCKVEWERVKFEAKHRIRKFNFDDEFFKYLTDKLIQEQLLAYIKMTGFNAGIEFNTSRKFYNQSSQNKMYRLILSIKNKLFKN